MHLWCEGASEAEEDASGVEEGSYDVLSTPLMCRRVPFWCGWIRTPLSRRSPAQKDNGASHAEEDDFDVEEDAPNLEEATTDVCVRAPLKPLTRRRVTLK